MARKGNPRPVEVASSSQPQQPQPAAPAGGRRGRAGGGPAVPDTTAGLHRATVMPRE
jgi:hypothetical protein